MELHRLHLKKEYCDCKIAYTSENADFISTIFEKIQPVPNNCEQKRTVQKRSEMTDEESDNPTSAMVSKRTDFTVTNDS